MTEAERAIPIMVQRIAEAFRPLRIVLFGSHARGTAHAGSDVDLLVVCGVAENKRRLAIEMGRLLRDLPVGKDIVVTTPEEIQRRGHLVGTVLRPALRDGKVLYERS